MAVQPGLTRPPTPSVRHQPGSVHSNKSKIPGSGGEHDAHTTIETDDAVNESAIRCTRCGAENRANRIFCADVRRVSGRERRHLGREAESPPIAPAASAPDRPFRSTGRCGLRWARRPQWPRNETQVMPSWMLPVESSSEQAGNGRLDAAGGASRSPSPNIPPYWEEPPASGPIPVPVHPAPSGRPPKRRWIRARRSTARAAGRGHRRGRGIVRLPHGRRRRADEYDDGNDDNRQRRHQLDHRTRRPGSHSPGDDRGFDHRHHRGEPARSGRGVGLVVAPADRQAQLRRPEPARRQARDGVERRRARGRRGRVGAVRLRRNRHASAASTSPTATRATPPRTQTIRASSELRLTFSDGSSQRLQLEDRTGYQTIEIEPKKTEWIRMTIVSTYPGEKWSDGSLSEIRFYDAPK